MMSKEILMVADAVSNEKGVSRDVIFEAIESALATASRRLHGKDEIDCRVSVNQDTGDYETFRVWTVVEEEEFEDPATQMTLEQAREKDPALEIGGSWEETLENIEFGRIAAQTAKQVIVQKVREAERERQYEEFKDRIGEIINGIVKRVEYGNVIVDLGRAEAIIRRDQLIPRETYRVGDRVRGDLATEPRSPRLLLALEPLSGPIVVGRGAVGHGALL